MCIIAVKPAGEKIEEQTYRDCFMRNPDGAGFSVVENGELIVKKGFFNVKDLLDEIMWREHQSLVVHFRTASPGMGAKEHALKNCHPFVCHSNHATKIENPPEGYHRWTFAIHHNGRLPWGNTAEHSDTSCYVRERLAPILRRDALWFEYENLKDLILRDITYTLDPSKTATKPNNKLVIMRWDREEEKEDVFIVNEKAGEWAGKIWYSNDMYRQPRYAGTWGKGSYTYPTDQDLMDMGFDPTERALWMQAYGGSMGMLGQFGRGAGPVKKPTHITAPATDYIDTTQTEAQAIRAKLGPAATQECEREINGWYWSFYQHCWYNSKDQKRLDFVAGRTAPYDVVHYKKTKEVIPFCPKLPGEKPGDTTVPATGTSGQAAEVVTTGSVTQEVTPTAGDLAEMNKPGDVIPTEGEEWDNLPNRYEPLAHLKEHEITMLCTEFDIVARRIMNMSNKELLKMKSWRKVKELRKHVIWVFDEMTDVGPVFVDCFIINKIKEGTFRTLCKARERKALKEASQTN